MRLWYQRDSGCPGKPRQKNHTEGMGEPDEPCEPPTSFKWVIIAALVIWALGAVAIFFTRY
jgi:hypothetical protein